MAIGSESRYVHEGIALFTEGEDADGAFVIQQGTFELARKRTAASSEVAGRAHCSANSRWSPRQAPGDGRGARAVHGGAHHAPAFLKMLEGYPDAAGRMRDAIATRANETTREFGRIRAGLMRGLAPK